MEIELLLAEEARADVSSLTWKKREERVLGELMGAG